MLVFGLMPVGGNGALGLGRIWCCIGFFLAALKLQRLELGVMGKATVSFNKAMACDLFWIRQLLMLMLAPAGQGGEGRKGGGVRICWSRSWWGSLLLVGDTHMVAFSASMIFGQQGGLSSVPMMGHLFNLLWRPFFSGSESAVYFLSIPSGRFPGDGEEGRRRGLLSRSGGGRRSGSDCFFTFCSKVFSAYSEGHVVIFVFSVVLYVSHRL
nr:uncharacterized protein LOC127307021 [Lolium perenne]